MTAVTDRVERVQRVDAVTGTAGAARSLSDPRYQAFMLLRTVFTVAPILMGIDKFFNLMVYWPDYLANWLNPGNAQHFMYFVGIVEIVAGLVVLVKPRYGSLLVAGWLVGIIVNLLSKGEYYDIAVRDFGLMVGALALNRLAWVYDKPLFGRF